MRNKRFSDIERELDDEVKERLAERERYAAADDEEPDEANDTEPTEDAPAAGDSVEESADEVEYVWDGELVGGEDSGYDWTYQQTEYGTEYETSLAVPESAELAERGETAPAVSASAAPASAAEGKKSRRAGREKKKKQPKRTLGVKKGLSTAAKIWIAAASVLVVVGAAAAIMYFSSGANKQVYVTSVAELDQGEYMFNEGDTSSGEVSSDNVQAEYLSETKTINQILVHEGDEVKKGDLIMTYDTTLDTLEVEKKALEVTQMELELVNLKDRLTEINNMKPSDPDAGKPKPTKPENPTGEVVLTYRRMGGTGTREDPFIFILAGTRIPCDEEFLEVIFAESDSVWVVFENRTADMTGGRVNNAWGVNYTRSETVGASFDFFDASEYIYTEEEEEVDMGSGYTAEEIAQMRAETQKEITDKDLEIRIKKNEVEQMRLELSGGEVYSRIDGVVTELHDALEAMDTGAPIIKIASGSGMYIRGSISELMLDNVSVGDTVTVSSYETGMQYDGTVESIIDMPEDDSGFFSEGASASRYPMTVYVEDQTAFNPGEYVSISLRSSQQKSIYLDSMYVFRQNGLNYVYVEGKDGLLEQRRVSVGGTMYGYLTIIDSGLSRDDYVAFPYGNNVRVGAKVEECGMNDFYNHLYGY